VGQEGRLGICIGVNSKGILRETIQKLFRFLLEFKMRFECGAILMFGLQFSFEFFYEQFEAADFVSQFLNFCRRRCDWPRKRRRSECRRAEARR